MLKKLKNILCITFVFVLSSFATLTVFAEEVVDPGVIVPEEQEIITTAAPEYTVAPEPYTEAPVYTQAPEPVTEAPVYTQAPVEEYTEYYTQSPAENYSFYEEPTEFQNQQDYYEAETTEATEQNTSLYKDVKDIDDTELKKKNWDNIAAELAKAKKTDKNSNSSPFDYIKNNEKATGFQAFLNNLNWALTAAIISFILAIICIIIFIVLTKKNKNNKLVAAGVGKISQPKGKSNGKTDSNGYYIPPSQREKTDYGDDYSSDLSRYDELIEPRKVNGKKKASQDTGEVVIPDKYRKF